MASTGAYPAYFEGMPISTLSVLGVPAYAPAPHPPIRACRLRNRGTRFSTVASALGFVLLLLLSPDASAFCQARTCDPKLSTMCDVQDGCVVSGAPLHWASRCLSFGTQRNGSPKRHISYEVADSIIQQAFLQWMKADCGGGKRPSFKMWDLGAFYGGVICPEPEFNSTKPNANVWMFRDNDWPYEGKNSTLALTLTIFEKSTGALLDADVEINSYFVDLTTTSTSGEVKRDLASIVTHEAGHFLGLAHSQNSQATMFQNYSEGDLDYRSLHADDEAGICSMYPPDRDAPTCSAPSPAHGFSLYCSGGAAEEPPGCRCHLGARDRGGRGTESVALLAAIVALGLARRRAC